MPGMVDRTQVVEPLHSANRLLARLGVAEYHRLRPHLEPVHLKVKEVLVGPHAPANRIYFLGSGVCSIMHSTHDGHSVAVAMVGNEGVIGIEAFGGDPEAGETATVQIVDATAEAMDAPTFERELASAGALNQRIREYAQVFAEALMQSVACNALHSIDQRLARCLMDISNRIETQELPVTQDTLAQLLGVRRASITLAARALQRGGIIEQGHRHILIRDVRGLERAACECYGTIKRCFARLRP